MTRFFQFGQMGCFSSNIREEHLSIVIREERKRLVTISLVVSCANYILRSGSHKRLRKTWFTSSSMTLLSAFWTMSGGCRCLFFPRFRSRLRLPLLNTKKNMLLNTSSMKTLSCVPLLVTSVLRSNICMISQCIQSHPFPMSFSVFVLVMNCSGFWLDRQS